MRRLTSGELHHRVVLRAPVRIEDDYGEPRVEMRPAARAWARIDTGPGREAPDRGRADAEITHTVTIRHRGDLGIDASWDVEHRGRTLRILSVRDPDQLRDRLELLCAEET